MYVFFGVTNYYLRRYCTDHNLWFYCRCSRYLQERKLGARLHSENVLHVDVGKEYEIASHLCSLYLLHLFTPSPIIR